jgi:hypothetical protein
MLVILSNASKAMDLTLEAAVLCELSHVFDEAHISAWYFGLSYISGKHFMGHGAL